MAEYWAAFVAWITSLWTDFVEFLSELPLLILDGFLSALAAIITAIPVPDFLDNGLDMLLDAVPDSVLYFLVQAGFPAALALIGAGVSFRLLRKAVTLFQW